MDNFLKEDYKQKVSYLEGQYGRMLTRFHIFLTIESGLLTGQVFAKQGDIYDFITINWALIFVSLLWYVFGAQDKYLMDTYRRHVQEAFHYLKEEKTFAEVKLHLPYTGMVNMKENKTKRKKSTDSEVDFQSLTSWRIRRLSVTNLVAIVPLLLIGVWCVVLYFNYRK